MLLYVQHHGKSIFIRVPLRATYGMKYVDQGAAFYDAQHRKLQISQLKWKAAKLGFQVVQAPAA
jgi:hypothetical protein